VPEKKYSMNSKFWSLLIVLIVILSSCKLREDLEKVNPVPKDHSVRVAVPVMDSRLTMADMFSAADSIVNTSEFLNIDDDGKITLVYTQLIEVPAFAGLDQIEVPDVIVPGISMDMSQDMPDLPAMDIDAGTISLRSIINDDELADNIDLVGVVGSTVNTTIVKGTNEVSETQQVDYGHFCVSDTQDVLGTEVITTQCTDTMSDATLDELGLGDGTIPCLDNAEYECIDVVRTEGVTMTLDSALELGLIEESDIDGDIIGDSIFVDVNEYIEPLEAQSIGAGERVVEDFSLEGFSYVTLEDGKILMTIRNHFPFDLENVVFEVKTGVGTVDSALLGTGSTSKGQIRFITIPALTTVTDSLDLADENLFGNISFQLKSMETLEYSGPIDVDSSIAISLVVRDLLIESGTGNKQALIDGGLIESDTLVKDTMLQTIDLEADLTISQVTLVGGSFNYSLSSTFATDLNIGLRIPDLIDSNGTEFNTIIALDYSGSIPVSDADSIDLEGYDLRIMEPGDTAGAVKVIYYAVLESQDDITFTDNIFFSFGASITNIKINEARGDFGRLEIPAIDTSINFDLYDAQFSGKIIFAEPSLAVIFSNSFGLPVGINFEMTGFNTNTGATAEVGNFNADNLIIEAPDSVGQTVVDTFLVDESNGLSDLFALPPNGMNLILGVVTNPDSTVVADNFISDSSSIGAEVQVSIPFVGRIENFELKDTIAFTLGQDIDVEKSTLTLNLLIENDFPVTVGMQLTFLDVEGTELGKLFEGNFSDSIFAASTVDESGELIAPSSRQKQIVLSGDKANMLADAAYIVIGGSLSTTGAEAAEPVDITFYSHYGFSIKMGILVSVNTDDLLPFMNN
jgi:hypothetical protein